MTVRAAEVARLWGEAWWAEFLTSPAVAGVAALVAAVLSLVLAGRRIRADRDLAAQQHAESRLAADRIRREAIDATRADRWWAMYQWVLSRLDVLHPATARSVLAALESQAPGEPERALVLIAGELVMATTDGGDDDA